MMLAKRARNSGGTAGQAGSAETKVHQPSLRELRLLSELTTRVDQLTKEVERLRSQARAADATAPKTKKGG